MLSVNQCLMSGDMNVKQVKVVLKLTLKLIVMTSLSVLMMTSQDRISAQSVTNGFTQK